MKIIDLSHLIEPQMTVFPDTDSPEVQQVATMAEKGFIETKITLYSHTGTHIDAPLHMLKGGKGLNEYNINCFIGNATIIDLTHNESGIIKVEDILKYEERITDVDYVIIKTGWSKNWRREKYFKGYPVLSIEAAKWLTKFNIKGIGIDAISVDNCESTLYPIHKVLLARELLIVENLTNLDEIDNNIFIFCCMPLKYEVADGSPVRAVAILK